MKNVKVNYSENSDITPDTELREEFEEEIEVKTNRNTKTSILSVTALMLFMFGIFGGIFIYKSLEDTGIQDNITKITQARKQIKFNNATISKLEKVNAELNSGTIAPAQKELKDKYNIIFQ